jgi:hypothetical protein
MSGNPARMYRLDAAKRRSEGLFETIDDGAYNTCCACIDWLQIGWLTRRRRV